MVTFFNIFNGGFKMKGTAEKLLGKVSSLVDNYLKTGKIRKNFLLNKFCRDKNTFFIHFTISNTYPETIHGRFELFITKERESCKGDSIYSEKKIKIITDSRTSFLMSFKTETGNFKKWLIKYSPSGDEQKNIRITFVTLESFWNKLNKLELKLFKKQKVGAVN